MFEACCQWVLFSGQISSPLFKLTYEKYVCSSVMCDRESLYFGGTVNAMVFRFRERETERLTDW